LKERMSVKTLLKEILQKAPIWREKLPELPDLIYGNLKQAQHNQSLLEQQNKLLQQQMLITEKQNRSLLYYIVGASLIITTAILFSADNQWGTTETVTIISSLIALAVGRVTGRK